MSDTPTAQPASSETAKSEPVSLEQMRTNLATEVEAIEAQLATKRKARDDLNAESKRKQVELVAEAGRKRKALNAEIASLVARQTTARRVLGSFEPKKSPRAPKRSAT